MKKLIILFLVLCIPMAPLADIPSKTEQFVYSISAFNGIDYNSATFCTADSDTIYMLANVDNFIRPYKSLVYYWELSASWQLDIDNLYKPLEGTLQVTGKSQETKSYPISMYTYALQSGEYEDKWSVYTGKTAEEEGSKFEALQDEYTRAAEQYEKDTTLFNQYTDTLFAEILKQQELGKDITRLLKQMDELKRPVPPEVPDYYVYPIMMGFLLNLPAGTYALQFTTPDGYIMEDSEKTLIVFEKRRANNVGYEIIPGDKWTIPGRSYTPSAVLYVDGTTNLYLKPFFEDEFNDLYYNKMIINQSRGNRSLYRWEKIRQVPDAKVEITDAKGLVRIINEVPYVVEQVPGATAGYTIVTYDPEGAHKDKQPDIKAFHVPVSAQDKGFTVRLLDKSENNHSSGTRQIRVIVRDRMQFWQVIFAFIPLLIFLIIILIRKTALAPMHGTGEKGN